MTIKKASAVWKGGHQGRWRHDIYRDRRFERRTVWLQVAF